MEMVAEAIDRAGIGGGGGGGRRLGSGEKLCGREIVFHSKITDITFVWARSAPVHEDVTVELATTRDTPTSAFSDEHEPGK
jgi:hypothetical protein